MADNILRLKVESSEYDAKLKKAAEGIRHLAEVAHQGGGELTGLEKAELDYVKALGSMETKSRTAAGSVRELENTFKELTVVYNQLNDVEKQDEGGKALAASLEQIKQRAQEAKAQLDAASKSLTDNGQQAQQSSGMLDALASKFTINIDALKLFDIGLQATKAALDVAKDAFMSSETNVDDWGRTVRSAEGIYQSFVQSLNTGDFIGFLSNIGRVTQAAQEAYNALDELGTRMTIINPERAKLQARQQELRADIRRNGADSEVGRAALAELKKIEPLLSKSFKTESQMNYTAFEKLVRERLAEGGINLNQKSFQQFMKTFSSDTAFQNLRRNARGSSELRETSEIGRFKTVDTRNIEQKLLDLFTDEWRQANSGYLTASFSAQGAAASNALGNARYMRAGSGGGKGGKSGKADIQFADDSIMAQEKLVQELTQQWKTASAEMKGGYLKQLNEAKAKLEEMTKGPNLDKLFPDLSAQKYHTGTVSRGDALMQSIRADIGRENMAIDQTTLTSIMTMAMKEGLDTSEIDANGLLERIFNGEDIPTEFWGGLMDRLNEALQDFGREAYDLDEKGNLKQRQRPEEKENIVKQDNVALKQLEKFNGDYSKVTGGVSSIVSGIQQMGVDIPEEIQSVLGVLTGISSIMTGITSILSLILIAENIQTTESTIKSIPVVGWALAHGGIVPHAANGYFVGGNNFSGDTTPIMANAGELVLNKAQQGNLASQLSGSGMQNLQLGTKVTAEEILFILKNNGRRTGKGEFVRTNSGRV